MTPDRWREVEALYNAAVARAGKVPSDADPELRREVESLLAQNTTSGVLGQSVLRPVAMPAANVAAGAMLGPYRIESQLGKGGMGEVWKAHDTRLGRDVAIKIAISQFSERFEREARAVAALNHPNICTIYDVGPNYLVMELIEGEAPIGPLPLDKVLACARQIGSALEAAHDKGIVHRDLKPANLKITPDGIVKVLDFGLAKTVVSPSPDVVHDSSHTASLTEAGTILGSAPYMAPEQAQGKPADKRADIWAFGVVLHELFAGQRLFQGKTPSETLIAVLTKEPEYDRIPPQAQRLVRACLEKDPKRRLRDIADAWRLLDEPSTPPTAARRASWLPWTIAALLAAGMVAALWAPWRTNAPVVKPWTLTRLTSDAGYSHTPALSRDGKLLAYSSDRDGKQDIYVQQVTGEGQAVRLTNDGEGNRDPDFSPDGTKIVFSSRRDGGGSFEVPALGGEVRRLAGPGLGPKYSPDGLQLAYWVGKAETISPDVPGTGELWVVSTSGGQARRLAANLTTARYPVWSPDGKTILVVGTDSKRALDERRLDWWAAPIDGGLAVQAQLTPWLVRAGLRLGAETGTELPRPACWQQGRVLLSARVGDTNNLMAADISDAGVITGNLTPLTTSSADEREAACAASGATAFTRTEFSTQLWALPYDLKASHPIGAIAALSEGIPVHEDPNLTPDGRRLAFTAGPYAHENVWSRDLASGKESRIAGAPFRQRFPEASPSGTKISFSSYEDKRYLMVATRGGTPERVCEDCLRGTDWSADERTLIVFGGNPYQIDLLDLAMRKHTPLFKHPTFNLLYGRYSPDQQWASFTARTSATTGRIVIAPIIGPHPVPESEWITIAEGGPEDRAIWSPDGKTLYYTSERDGYVCLWGQHIDPSHHPVGAPFPVGHWHDRLAVIRQGWAAAADRIVLTMRETSGNIWLMSHPPEPSAAAKAAAK